MRKRITTGPAALTEVSGEARCGGVAERTKKLHPGVNFRNTFAKMMNRKVIRRNPKVSTKRVVSFVKRLDIRLANATRTQTLGLSTMWLMNKSELKRILCIKRS